MSDQAHENSQPKAEFFDQRHAGNLTLVLPVVGIVALVASFIWGFFNAEQFAYSWLFAFTYFFTLAVGSMFWTLVHHATDAEWTVVVRRVLENVAVLIPYVFIFFIPLLFCAPILWKWWDLDPHRMRMIADKQPYLNPIGSSGAGWWFTSSV